MRHKIAEYYHRLKTHPNSWLRIGVGIFLVIGGILGALPILGFWMIPLGIALLAVDFPWARRIYLRFIVMWRRLRQLFRTRRAKKQSTNDIQKSTTQNTNQPDTTPTPSSDDH